MEEVWKDIGIAKGIDYTGFYQVSNMGRIKSLDRIIMRSNGRQHTCKNKIMSCCISLSGYIIVKLSKNLKYKSHLVHKLELTTFVPNLLNKRTVNHKDGNKLNNNLNNLEWATDIENIRHAFDTRLMYFRPVMMLSLDNEPLRIFRSIKEASKQSGAFESSISACCKKKKNYKTAGGYKWEFYKKGEKQ